MIYVTLKCFKYFEKEILKVFLQEILTRVRSARECARVRSPECARVRASALA